MKEESTLQYLRTSLERSSLLDIEFNAKAKFHKVPRSIIERGFLEDVTTEHLINEYKDKDSGSKTSSNGVFVPIVLSLQTLIDSSSKRSHGMLLVTCSMNNHGELSFDLQSNYAWLPLSRLRANGKSELDVMLGELSAFRRFQIHKAERIKSAIQTWQDYLRYADDMFDEVFEYERVQKSLEDYSYTIDSENCYLRLYDGFDATELIVAMYSQLLGGGTYPDLISSVLNPGLQVQLPVSEIDRALIDNMKDNCGHVSGRFSLVTSQRRAVFALNQLGYGKVLAISGPPGTGKTTVVQDMVANLVTKHALEGKPAPIILGMSVTNQAVTNIIDSFANIVSSEPGTLNFRWLLHINVQYDNKGIEVRRKIEGSIPGLATYLPSNDKLLTARQKGYLFDFVNRSSDGTYSQYSAREYWEWAIPCFLESAGIYFQKDISSLRMAKKELLNTLRMIDRHRKELIDSYAILGSLQVPSILQEQIARCQQMEMKLSDEYTYNQTRLQFWDELQYDNRPRWFRRRSNQNQIIVANRAIGETIVNECKTLEEVCSVYKSNLNNIETQILGYRQEVAVLEEKKDRYDYLLDLCKQQIINLSNRCKLSQAQEALMLSILQAPGISYESLDKALDTTVRVTEFWLAVHFYECCWLISCEEGQIIDEDERFKSTMDIRDLYWSQAPCLTPCFIVTAYMLPRLFRIYTKDGVPKFDFERVDLLIVDEAGQVDVPIGLAGFAVAQRAVVVGDTKQLDPIWSFDEESDKEIALEFLTDVNDWLMLKNAGSTASSDSSLMRLVTRVCPWKYSEEEGGLLLTEHFRCSPEIIKYCNDLLYHNRLLPQRPLSSRDLNNPLRDTFLPMSYCIVENSVSQAFGASRRNHAEATAIVKWLDMHFDLIRTKYQGRYEENNLVGIVTPFAAQAKLIEKTLENEVPSLSKLITVGTAHKLQGAERPVILFSCVYGNNDERSSFIENTPKLMNVSVSRAIDVFMVFCSDRRVYESGKVLSTLFRYVRKTLPEENSLSLVEND